MTLNPITALSDQFQKLINEHGSAAILRDHLALFRDQVALLEKKASLLGSENTFLQSENQKLKMEYQNLEAGNDELQKKYRLTRNLFLTASSMKPKLIFLSL